MNFEYHICTITKKLCFVHSIVSCDNIIMATIMRVFRQSEEYTKLYAFIHINPLYGFKVCCHTRHSGGFY